jgi:20S proteasome alpha/beta subunit
MTALIRIMVFALTLSGALSFVPWQQETRRDTSQEPSELPANVFASNGRLPSMEKVIPLCLSNDPACSLAIAILTKEGIAVVAARPKSPYLYDPSPNVTKTESKNKLDSYIRAKSVPLFHTANTKHNTSSLLFEPPFTYLAPNLLGITVGNPVDSQVLRLLMQNIAASSRASQSILTARSMARSLADQLQQRTQVLGKGRLLASTAVFIDAQELWRVEPTGQFYQCQVAVAGRAGNKIEIELSKNLQTGETETGPALSSVTQKVRHERLSKLTTEQALQLATRTIHSVLSTDKSEECLHLIGLSTTVGGRYPSKLTGYTHESLMNISVSL